MVRAATTALLMVVSVPGHAEVISGGAIAQDGDSLDIGGKRIRLFGIDAPEFDQTCQKDDASWPCGEAAKAQLAELMAGQRVECIGQGVDQYGRMLGICSAGRTQLNQVMAEQGWALAFRQFSDAYVAAELQAKAQRRGIWSSSFEQPSDFRQSKLPPDQRTTATPRVAALRPAKPVGSGGCAIKGNRNRRGQWIYHLPGMPYYDQTRPEEIFCTEAEARAAGYRRAIVRP